jgi:hypothetical protein
MSNKQKLFKQSQAMPYNAAASTTHARLIRFYTSGFQ